METLSRKPETTKAPSAVIRRLINYVLPWLLCLLLVLPATYRLFTTPLFVGHDYTHVGRITEMVGTLKSGQFPPRWSQHLGFGYGMPLFSFYAPLPYYVGSLLVIFGLSASTSVSLLFFLATWGSSVAMFFLARNGSQKYLVPFVSAALFTYLPYRAVDMYVRGALGELWGIWFLVVVLLALQNLFRAPTRNRVVVYAISLALFLLSHNLMVLLGLPLIVGVIVMHYTQQPRAKKSIATFVLVGTLLGVGMSAYFLFPMFFEKQFTSVSELSRIAGGYRHHFVYWKQLFFSKFSYGGSIEGIHDGLSFSLGTAGWLVILSSLAVGFRLSKKSKKKLFESQVFFWILITFTTLFFTSQKSSFIWRLLEPLGYLQFPWRFLSLLLVALPLLFSSTVNLLENNRSKKIISAVVFTLLLFEVQNFTPNPDTKGSNVASITELEYIKTDLSKTIPDYIHPELSALVSDSSKTLIPTQTRFESSPPIAATLVKDTATGAQVLIPPLKEQTKIRLNIFDFPGWQWKLDGVRIGHEVAPDLPVMEIMLPPSSSYQTLAVVWSETVLRKGANTISAICWIGVLTYALIKWFLFFTSTMKQHLSRP